MNVSAASFTSPGIQTYNVTVNDGETTFTQRFGVAVYGSSTAIQTIDNAQAPADSAVYGINGIKLRQSQKGINIIGGKKVVLQ